MAQGSKAKYTSKQKRQAKHIADSYAEHGTGGKEAKRRAWATVNAETGGGKKSGSGRGKKTNTGPSKKGGKKGGRAAAERAGTKKGTKKTTKAPARRRTKRTGTKKRASR